MNPGHLQRALALARQGLGRTAPNPPVGAVVVKATGEVVGEGHHLRVGEPHAEALALRQAGPAAAGGTVYCTLEPCCHQGRTPPCTDAIITAGVRRVVYAMQDPDPRCAGGGAEALRQVGIEVEHWEPDRRGTSPPPTEEPERPERVDADVPDAQKRVVRASRPLGVGVTELYEPYLKHKRTGLPFVTLKMACTLDGRAAARTGDSRWVTGEAARALVHQWRNENEAVMVGVGTVLADDPQLTARGEKQDDREPLRVIVDTHARTPATAQALRVPGSCLIAVGERAEAARVEALEQAGTQVLRLPERDGRVDLEALLQALGQRDVMGLFVEGGPKLAAGLLQQGLVDKLRLFYAPKLLGGDALPAIGNLGLDMMSQALQLDITCVDTVGADILVTAYPCSPD